MLPSQRKVRPCKNLPANGWGRHLLLIAAVTALFCLSTGAAAAQEHHGPPTGPDASLRPASGQTILGDVLPFGNGTARSWVHVDGRGEPTTLGITLTEAALEGLPAEVTPGLIWMVEYILSIPEMPLLPFDHIGVNWNPRGHIPAGIYNVPHFDFHFYTISPEQRSQITARGEDLERCRRSPMPGHLPEGYVFAPESEEPGMGGHWIDPLSHEFHGKDFTSTFLFGTHEGGIIFWEPMITKAYLETKPDASMPLQVPQEYARDGYYPTGYSIRYDAGRKEYTVALEGLTLRRKVASR